MTEDLSGLTIKGYKLSERIGAGGFGAVYTADQSTVGRRVAVKIILPGYANQPDFIRRFESEARLVARLEHPYIVPLYDYWRDPSGAYLVMRWLRGGSLSDALQERPFTPAMAARILDQVASGLSLAHRSGVVHRDIKPSNILLDEEGNAYLSDFGIAQELKRADDEGRGKRLVGTLDYLSPEQAKNEPAGPQSDIYSLGITLYELLTGQHPFPGHSSVERLFKHINDPLPEIEDLGEQVNDVLRKATAKNPAQRYADALEMAAAFRQAARLDEDGESASVVETLTPREQQILGLIVKGKTNRQIAQELFIEVSTVKWYISQIYRKLGVRSRVQAMVRARELRLVVPGPEAVEQEPKSTSVSISLPEPANPYKGLKAFEAADSRDFFGREALVERLISRLDGAQGQPGPRGRFLAIVGPSGSGKSSLVQAGLIPAMWRGALPGSEHWFVVEMMPGARPLDELEVALTRVAANQTERLHEQLQRDENGLLRVAGLILPNDGSELVLIIDQFEELFTLVDAEDERLFFLNLLQRAVSDPRSRVRVVITLRADFYHRPLQYPNFGELVRGQMETVLPLSAVELERAIVRPAEQAGARFEEGLAPTIIEDVRYQPGGLPLMQYALTELFDRREEHLLTRSAYEALGGIAGALAGRAESLYQELDPDGQEATRQLFLHLTTVEQGMDGGQMLPVTRRRVPRSELRAVAGDTELMDEVIDTFAAYRLLSLNHDPATRRPTVEVAHEAILVCWERLKYWLEESRDDLRQRRRLQRLTGDWLDAGQDPSFLLSGTQLDLFVDWAAGTDLALAAGEKDFLAANIAAREERLAEKEARQRRELETAQQLAETEKRRAEEQAQAAGRLRNRALLLAGALLIAAALAVVALGFARSSSQNAATAATRAAEALANLELAATNEAQAVANEEQALFNETLAEENAALAATREAEAAANAQLAATRQVLAEDEAQQRAAAEAEAIQEREAAQQQARLATSRELALAAINSLQVDPELSILLALQAIKSEHTAEAEEALHQGLQTSRIIKTLPGHTAGVINAIFSPDGTRAATVSDDKTVKIWQPESGRILQTIPFTGSEYLGRTLMFDGSGNELALITVGDALQSVTLSIWDIGRGALVREQEVPIPVENWSMFLSPNWQWIIAGRENGTAELWEVASGEKIHTFAGHEDIVDGLAFSSDSSTLAVTSQDGQVTLWDMESILADDAATSAASFNTANGATLINVAFSNDGRQLALIYIGSPEVEIWNLADTSQPQASLTNHSNVINHVAFHPDDTLLVTGSSDGTAKMWDPFSGEELFTLSGHQGVVIGINYSPDGERLISASTDGVGRIWDARPSAGGELATFATGAPGPDLEISPDEERFALGNFRGPASIWDVNTGERLLTLAGEAETAVYRVDFSPDGSEIATAGGDGIVRVWDAKTGEMLLSFLAHSDGRTAGFFTGTVDISYSPDGRHLATTGADGVAKVWDAETGEELLELAGHTAGLHSITYSPDGKLIATSSDVPDMTVRVWDTESGKEIFTLGPYPTRIWGLDFSPDSTLLATGDSSGYMAIWHMHTGEMVSEPRGITTSIGTVAFSPDGKRLISGSNESATLWDVETGEKLLNISPASNWALALTGDGRRLFGAVDSPIPHVRVYTIPLEDTLAQAETRLTRPLTDAECQQYLHVAACPES